MWHENGNNGGIMYGAKLREAYRNERPIIIPKASQSKASETDSLMRSRASCTSCGGGAVLGGLLLLRKLLMMSFRYHAYMDCYSPLVLGSLRQWTGGHYGMLMVKGL